MAFTVCQMKYQLQFIVLFSLMVGSRHLVTAIRLAGPVSSIEPNEEGGNDGCELTVRETSRLIGTGRNPTTYFYQVSNKCKSCNAQNIVLQLSFKNPKDRPVLQAMDGPIAPGFSRDAIIDLPVSFEIADISFWHVNYVC